jgi:hypothetical protein
MKKFALIFLVVFFLLSPLQVKAQIPFGGKIAFIIPCLNDAWYLFVYPVAGPDRLVYQEGVSILHEYKQIRTPGVNILGLATVETPCIVSIDPLFILWGNLIYRVGTSLTP